MGQFAGDGGEKEREAAAHDAWFRREVQIGLDSANAGRLVSGDVVEAEAAAWRDAAAKMPDATSATHSDLTRVLALAATLQPDRAQALLMVESEPIQALGNKTLSQLLQDGRADEDRKHVG